MGFLLRNYNSPNAKCGLYGYSGGKARTSFDIMTYIDARLNAYPCLPIKTITRGETITRVAPLTNVSSLISFWLEFHVSIKNGYDFRQYLLNFKTSPFYDKYYSLN